MLVYYIGTFLLGLCGTAISAYPAMDWPDPSGDPYLGVEDYTDGLSPYAPYIPDARPYSNDLYLPSYTKRAQWAQHTGGKRATLNQLLRRLVALYGDRDIHYSGRSSHVRFGAGGRR